MSNRLLSLTLLIFALSAGLAWSGSPSFTGKVTHNGNNLDGATIEMACSGTRNYLLWTSYETSTATATTNSNGYLLIGNSITTDSAPTCGFKITHSLYAGTYTESGITASTSTETRNFEVSSSLTRKTATATVTTSPEEATVSYSYDNTNWNLCPNKVCTVEQERTFYLRASANDYVTKTESQTGITQDTTYTITLARIVHTLSGTVNPASATVTYVYTGQTTNNNCDVTSGIYTCNIQSGREFILTANAEHYAPQTITSTINENTISNIDLTRISYALTGTVNPATAIITYTYTSDTIINSCTVNSGAYNCNIQSGREFKLNTSAINYRTQIETITINQPTTRNINLIRVWQTQISVLNPIGTTVTDYTMTGDCTTTPCELDNNAHTITVNKEGYLTNITSIPANNNGSPVSITLYPTLRINVTDYNNNSASGTASITGTELTGTVTNGIAWIPVNPELNNNELTIKFESQTYITNTTTLAIGALSNNAVTTKEIKTTTKRVLTINVEDYYTNQTVTGTTITAKATETYTGNPVSFDTATPPETVNVTVERQGYYKEEVNGVSTGSGTVTIKLKPTAVVSANIDFNVTVIDTKNTISEIDDESIMTIQSINKTASLPLNKDNKYIVILKAQDYKNKTIGPFITGNQIIALGPALMELIIDPSTFRPPEVTSIITTPSNPKDNETITIHINATDESTGNHTINGCYLRVDNSVMAYFMNSEYNNHTIKANVTISPLSAGNRIIKIQCSDDNDGLGIEKELIINVKSTIIEPITPSEPQTITKSLMLNDLLTKYEMLIKTGLNTEEITTAVKSAQTNINTAQAETIINNAIKKMPLISLQGGGTIQTSPVSEPAKIARMIAVKENQPYSENELINNMLLMGFQKTIKKYSINGEEKTLVTLRINSPEEKSNIIIADINPGTSSAQKTIHTEENSITYFKGLNQGENVFEYVIEGHFNETSEPVIFTMKELSGTEKTLKEITGFNVGIPGIIEMPLIYIIVGIACLALIIKFLI